MGKKAIFQDLPLMPPRTGEERWRWVYGQLRAAILMVVSGPALEYPHPATWQSNTVSHAAPSWPRLVI